MPNVRGWRKDVVQALKALKVPLIRWPGGCFADAYHWREGIPIKTWVEVTLRSDGTLGGAVAGTWSHDGANTITLTRAPIRQGRRRSPASSSATPPA